VDDEVVTTTAIDERRVPDIPRSLWQRIHDDPARAPEHIALAAAERFAPPADRWARRMHGRHPPAELGRIARTHHVNLSRLEGGLAGLGGGFTVALDLAALAWIQGRMVFFIAAAHGFDPHDPMRPAELLALQGIYSTPAEARDALDGVGRPMAVQYIASKHARDEALTRRLLKVAGRTLMKRTVYRVAPILSAPVSATQNGWATGQLGDAAIAYYGRWSSGAAG
jgi:hypothetical protein